MMRFILGSVFGPPKPEPLHRKVHGWADAASAVIDAMDRAWVLYGKVRGSGATGAGAAS